MILLFLGNMKSENSSETFWIWSIHHVKRSLHQWDPNMSKFEYSVINGTILAHLTHSSMVLYRSFEPLRSFLGLITLQLSFGPTKKYKKKKLYIERIYK